MIPPRHGEVSASTPTEGEGAEMVRHAPSVADYRDTSPDTGGQKDAACSLLAFCSCGLLLLGAASPALAQNVTPPQRPFSQLIDLWTRQLDRIAYRSDQASLVPAEIDALREQATDVRARGLRRSGHRAQRARRHQEARWRRWKPSPAPTSRPKPMP